MNINNVKLEEIISNSENRVDLWEQFLKETNVKTMVEVGVWKGDFAKSILEACKEIEQYIMVDPWTNLSDWNKPFNVNKNIFDDIYFEAMEKTKFASEKIFVLRGTTKDVIDQIEDESLDFVYIDGDHTLRGITIDLIKLFPKIKKGGCIGGDDFVNNLWQHDAQYEPTLVCPFSIYFSEAMNVPIVALPYNQFLISKTDQEQFFFKDFTNSYNDISLNKISFKHNTYNDVGLIKKILSFRKKLGAFLK